MLEGRQGGPPGRRAPAINPQPSSMRRTESAEHAVGADARGEFVQPLVRRSCGGWWAIHDIKIGSVTSSDGAPVAVPSPGWRRGDLRPLSGCDCAGVRFHVCPPRTRDCGSCARARSRGGGQAAASGRRGAALWQRCDSRGVAGTAAVATPDAVPRRPSLLMAAGGRECRYDRAHRTKHSAPLTRRLNVDCQPTVR
jgi:hypothetical protein